MKCSKCTGYMIRDMFFDIAYKSDGWKCLNCGKILVDPDKRDGFHDELSFHFKLYEHKKNIKLEDGPLRYRIEKMKSPKGAWVNCKDCGTRFQQYNEANRNCSVKCYSVHNWKSWKKNKE